MVRIQSVPKAGACMFDQHDQRVGLVLTCAVVTDHPALLTSQMSLVPETMLAATRTSWVSGCA